MRPNESTIKSMPVIGLGTWKMDDGVATNSVATAIQLGYRHIDCAPIYLNEPDVGKALSRSFADGVVTREELWITSKLWCNRHRPDLVATALKQTLADLQLDYLDLFMIHWPIVFRHDIHRPEQPTDFIPLERMPLIDTWQAMEDCADQGLCRNLGVCNFNSENLQQILAGCRIHPFANQVECHPYLRQRGLLNFCESNQVQLVAYSPLGSGDRPERMRDQSDPGLFQDDTIRQLADANACSPAQLLLAWAVNRGTVAIPKSTNSARLTDNLGAAELKLDSETMKQLDSLPTQHRFVHGRFWEMPGGPYTAQGIWGTDEQ